MYDIFFAEEHNDSCFTPDLIFGDKDVHVMLKKDEMSYAVDLIDIYFDHVKIYFRKNIAIKKDDSVLLKINNVVFKSKVLTVKNSFIVLDFTEKDKIEANWKKIM